MLMMLTWLLGVSHMRALPFIDHWLLLINISSEYLGGALQKPVEVQLKWRKVSKKANKLIIWKILLEIPAKKKISYLQMNHIKSEISKMIIAKAAVKERQRLFNSWA